MIRRTLFGLLWFGIFWVVLMGLGGALAGLIASPPDSSQEGSFGEGFRDGLEVGVRAGAKFRDRYGAIILISAAALAVAGTATKVLPGTKR